MIQDSQNVACAKHTERIAVAVCDDCNDRLCDRCAIEVRDVGTFCWSCAARRGGLHHRPRAHVPQPPAKRPSEAVEPVVPPAGQSSLSVQLFESMVADRESRPLISGLTERLEDAGADPEDVVDDDELIEDIGHLQDLASTRTEHKGWWHRS
jgi:hypothetical protein